MRLFFLCLWAAKNARQWSCPVCKQHCFINERTRARAYKTLALSLIHIYQYIYPTKLKYGNERPFPRFLHVIAKKLVATFSAYRNTLKYRRNV